MRAGIVVPTRNRAALLPALLTALDAQEYPDYEVVIVDDASTDATPDILRAWQGESRIALRLKSPAGSYVARNAGWRTAHADIVAFTDDDCLPQPGWLSGLVDALKDGTAAGAQGVTLPIPGEITPFTHQIEQTQGGPPYRTCNIAYRRGDLDRLGGFDGRLRWYADNILGLRMRAHGPIRFVSDAIVYHPPRPREWRDRATWRERFVADAAHRQVLYEYGAEPAVPGSVLPVMLWIFRPLAKQGLTHLCYLAAHPGRYVRGMRPLVREKGEMLIALWAFWRDEHVASPLHAAVLPPLPDSPLVSVVVVTRDRVRLLEGLLDALAGQTWRHHETIVVEHRSHDAQVLSEARADRYVAFDGETLGAARDAGVQMARGDIVAFTDDDCLPDGRWLEALVRAFQANPDLRGVQGRTEAQTGPIGSYAVRVSRPDALYQTCNIAYRREVIEEARGFDHAYRGWFEDTALGARVREQGPIGFAADARVVHRAMPRRLHDRATWAAILQDERRLSRSFPDFYHRTRGRSFVLAVIVHWLLGSALKTLLRDLPRAGQDPRGYSRLVVDLIKERVELVRSLGQILPGAS